MKKLMMILFGVCLFLSFTSAATNVSQYGITWYFDGDYQTGQFANGDYWVVGPVTIINITPEYNGVHNGWEVNPIVSGGHGFDSRISGFDSSLVPNLPYVAQPGDSILKYVSDDPVNPVQTRVYTLDAAVLTVVGEVPPNNGATVFRPPYVGNAESKRTGEESNYYSTENLHTEYIPSLVPTEEVLDVIHPLNGGVNRADSAERTFERVMILHKEGAIGRSIRPSRNLYDYQPTNMVDWNKGMLRLMLNDSIEDKMSTIIGVTQAGIDAYHAVLHGQTFGAGGGHNPGYSMIISFAALMLDDSYMKDELASADYFWEQMYLYDNVYGQRTWGAPATNEDSYWNYISTGDGSRSARDPYGYIDGGAAPGTAYQLIVSQPFKGQVLSFLLIPEMNDVFNQSNLLRYVDRWVNFGKLAQPDPCAPIVGIYGIDYGPDPNNPGMCILDSDLEYYNSPTDWACQIGEECGRYPEVHFTEADTGSRDSNFQRAMWNSYYPNSSEIQAENCSQEAVQQAIDSAEDGDTVRVPAGECLWDETITIENKSIFVQGEGIDKTNLSSENNMFFVEGDKQFRISGFTISNAGSTGVYIQGNSKNWRVDHTKFLSSSYGVFVKGNSYGLVDNCIMNDTTSIFVEDNLDDYYGHRAWTLPLELGSANAVYIENSTLFNSRLSDARAGGRLVLRANNVTNGEVEIHSGCPNGMRATFSYEVYRNYFFADNPYSTYRVMNLRSGTGVIFNNSIEGVYDATIHVDNQRSCLDCTPPWDRCDGDSIYDGNNDATGWPCRDQIGRSTDTGVTSTQSSEPLYEWENSFNGKDTNITLNPAMCVEMQNHIQEGRDFYNNIEKPNYTSYIYPHPLTQAPFGTEICGEGEITEECWCEGSLRTEGSCEHGYYFSSSGCHHPADTSPNNCVIDINELTAYVNSWKSDLSISINSVMEAINYWKQGGY